MSEYTAADAPEQIEGLMDRVETLEERVLPPNPVKSRKTYESLVAEYFPGGRVAAVEYDVAHPETGSIETPEAAAYLAFREAARALKLANEAAIQASERFKAALQKLSEAAAP